MKQEFKKGDVVCLKSGSSKMVIERFDDERYGGESYLYARVNYWNSKTDKIEKEWVNTSSLIKVEEENENEL